MLEPLEVLLASTRCNCGPDRRPSTLTGINFVDARDLCPPFCPANCLPIPHPLQDCTTLFDSGSGGNAYQGYWSDFVNGYLTYQPQLSSQQACACTCAADPQCDAWTFFASGNGYYARYPGCSFYDIKDSSVWTPCSFPQEQYPEYHFWVRAGKYTNIPACW